MLSHANALLHKTIFVFFSPQYKKIQIFALAMATEGCKPLKTSPKDGLRIIS